MANKPTKTLFRIIVLALVYLTGLASNFLCNIVSNDPDVAHLYSKFRMWFLLVLGGLVTIGLILALLDTLATGGDNTVLAETPVSNSKQRRALFLSLVIGVTLCIILTWWSALFTIFH